MVVYGLGLLAPTLSGKTLQPMLVPLALERRARAVPAILSALGDTAPAVRVAALDATARFAVANVFEPKELPAVEQATAHILRADESPVLRGRAAYALAYVGADKSVHGRTLRALVTAFAAEDDANARWHEMWALAIRFAKDVDQQTLDKALKDSSNVVRLQALRALERRKSSTWIEKITPLASDPDWRVNEEAREALTLLRGGKRSEHLAAIPAGVITPTPQPSVELAPLPRTKVSGKPARPAISALIERPHIVADTVATITGPSPGLHPRVAMVTTKGTMQVVLYPEWAPETVTNFLQLANRGYYDGIRWFRVVPDFVAQSGDRTNKGDGDAGYTIRAEENPVEQDSGIISMGLNYDKNGPQRDSAGSQFYVTMAPALHLNRDFTVFGRIEEGFDVLGRLVESDRILRIDRLADAEPRTAS